MNLFLEVVRELPLRIHLMWAAWIAAGLLLLVWQVRERGAEAEQSAREQAAWAKARAKSGPRPAVRVAKPAVVAPDAFGELEALLEPVAAGDAGTTDVRRV